MLLEKLLFYNLAITDDCTETARHLLIFLSKLFVMRILKPFLGHLFEISSLTVSWLFLWPQLVDPSCTPSKKYSSWKLSKRLFRGKIWLIPKSMMKSTRSGLTLLDQNLVVVLCDWNLSGFHLIQTTQPSPLFSDYNDLEESSSVVAEAIFIFTVEDDLVVRHQITLTYPTFQSTLQLSSA